MNKSRMVLSVIILLTATLIIAVAQPSDAGSGDMDSRSMFVADLGDDNVDIQVDDTELFFDGTPKVPELTITVNGVEAIEGIDYYIECYGNVAPTETAQLYIYGMGNLTGYKFCLFSIHKGVQDTPPPSSRPSVP